MFTMKHVDRERKLRFLFDIYDIDGDGLICNSELYKVLKMMVGSNLKEDQLQQIVDKTILQLDKDSDGMINYQEFCDISYNVSLFNTASNVPNYLVLQKFQFAIVH